MRRNYKFFLSLILSVALLVNTAAPVFATDAGNGNEISEGITDSSSEQDEGNVGNPDENSENIGNNENSESNENSDNSENNDNSGNIEVINYDNQIALTSEGELGSPAGTDIIYVSSTEVSGNDTDTGDGSEANPYSQLYTAIENASSGATIIVKDKIYVNDRSNNSAPLIINKNLTIKGDGDHPTLNTRTGGIVLGGNVTFENITLSFANSVRNEIMANGYTLTLDSVRYDSSAQGINLFCGGIVGYSGPEIPNMGSHGQIIIRNGSSLGDPDPLNLTANIYAGNLIDNIINSDDSTMNIPATITVESMVGDDSSKSKLLGTIFAKGAVVSNGLGIDLSGTKVTPPKVYPGKGNITGDVTINLCSDAVKNVYADQGNDKYATISFSSSDAYLNPDIFLDQAGAINVLSGYFQLAASSSFASNNMPLLIADGARLDVDKMYTASAPVLNVGDFAGGGTIGLNNNQTLHVNGQATGNTKVALTPTSALKGNTYVSFNSPQTGASFEFDSTTNNWQLSYDPAAKSYIAGDGSDITDDNVDYGPTYNGNENFANLVVFVDFSNTTHKHKAGTTDAQCFAKQRGARLTFNKYFDGDDNHPMAMKRYLDKVSYGELRVVNYFPLFDENSGMIESVQLTQSESVYVNNENAMITEIAQTLNNHSLCNGMNLDLEGNDDILDNLTIVVPSDENNETKFTSHKSTYGGDQTKIAGKMIGNYNVIHETGIYQSYSESALIIHEFMHSLGYPDLYRTRGMDQTGTPVGRFDIMSSVSKNVQYPLAYLRYKVRGWIPEPETVTSSRQHVELYAPTTAPSKGSKQAIIIKTPYKNDEIFVAEYRKQPDNNLNEQEYDYFASYYNSGLIIYRVNLGKDDLYNTHSGGDAVYVFRPEDTRNASGGETGSGRIQNAALTSSKGSITTYPTVSSFGSSDPSASTEQNAITYSDGHNSGIVIKNVGVNTGNTITFDIEMNDIPYDWEIITDGEASEYTKTCAMHVASDGTIYVARTYNSGLTLYSFDEGSKSYTQLAILPSASTMSAPKLAEYNGKIYIAYVNSNNKPVMYAYSGGTSSKVYEYSGSGTINEVSLNADDGIMGMAFSDGDIDNTNGYMYVVKSGAASGQLYTINNSLGVHNPAATLVNGKPAVVYRDKNNKLSVVMLEGSSFTQILSNDIYSAGVCVGNGDGKTFLIASNYGGNTQAYQYNKNTGTWQSMGVIADYYSSEITCNVTNGVPCVLYTNGDASSTKAKQYKDGSWVLIGGGVENKGYSSPSFVSQGGKLYVSYVTNLTNKVTIKKYIGNIWDPSNTDTDPGDTTESTVVNISVPSGYEGSLICIDGVNYEGLNESGSTYSADPGNKTSKVAVVYKNDAKGVPRGMYIWTLRYVNGAYVATPQPELADLIVAQGFSVRITGVSGIRFRSAMNTSQRQALEGSGLAGFKLKEFGTIYTGTRNIVEGRPLLINQSYTSGDQDPSVKIDDSGNKVKEIVTKENDKDIISFVITNMPADKYKNVYYFRAYANLIKDGEMITVYGPIRSKSLFAVADQLLATNNYKTTSEKNALQKMVNDANNATP